MFEMIKYIYGTIANRFVLIDLSEGHVIVGCL